MLCDRGVHMNHTTLFWWIQAYAPELNKRIRPHFRMTNGSRRVDETYIRVKGKWVHLYRAVDAHGQTIDFLLSPTRDGAAAPRFFREALKQAHTFPCWGMPAGTPTRLSSHKVRAGSGQALQAREQGQRHGKFPLPHTGRPLSRWSCTNGFHVVPEDRAI